MFRRAGAAARATDVKILPAIIDMLSVWPGRASRQDFFAIYFFRPRTPSDNVATPEAFPRRDVQKFKATNETETPPRGPRTANEAAATRRTRDTSPVAVEEPTTKTTTKTKARVVKKKASR